MIENFAKAQRAFFGEALKQGYRNLVDAVGGSRVHQAEATLDITWFDGRRGRPSEHVPPKPTKHAPIFLHKALKDTKVNERNERDLQVNAALNNLTAASGWFGTWPLAFPYP